jgi:hypothetical protein
MRANSEYLYHVFNESRAPLVPRLTIMIHCTPDPRLLKIIEYWVVINIVDERYFSYHVPNGRSYNSTYSVCQMDVVWGCRNRD